MIFFVTTQQNNKYKDNIMNPIIKIFVRYCQFNSQNCSCYFIFL